ncbi:MAG: IS4/Tn5 family transposase DNA-binding protein [Enterovibrio sp.]
MVFLTDAGQWATKTFSQADRGDLRRTKRLVKLTASLADHIEQSIVQSLKSPSDIALIPHLFLDLFLRATLATPNLRVNLPVRFT